MPKHERAMPAQPINFMAHYLTARDGIAQSRRLNSIDAKLSALPAIRSLRILCQVMQEADEAGLSPERQLALAQRLFRPTTARKVALVLHRDRSAVAVSSQVLLNLALRVLVFGSDDDLRDRYTTDQLTRSLGDLVLALADHTHTTRSTETPEEALALELVRLGLFFQVHDLPSWYAVTNEILFEVLPDLQNHPMFVDIPELVERAYGLTLDRFWSLTVAYGTLVRTTRGGHELPWAIEGNVDQSEIDRWMDAWSIDLEAAKKRARGDIAESGWWNFSACYSRPILRTDSSAGLALRPVFLAQKAALPGMFWAIRDQHVAEGGRHEELAVLFGAATEECGRRMIKRALPKIEAVTEKEIPERWGQGKCCDLVLVDSSWVAIEFVFRQFTRLTTTSGQYESLLEDLKLAVVKKLVQIDRTLERALLHEPAPDFIYPLVIVGGPFPANVLMSREVDRLLATEAHVIGFDSRVRPPAVIDLAELGTVLGVARHTGTGLSEILENWLSSDIGGGSLRNWLVTDGPGRTVPLEEFIPNDYFSRVSRCLYGRDVQSGP